VVTSSSPSSIIALPKSKISFYIIGFSFKNMQFVVLVSILGVLVYIPYLVCVVAIIITSTYKFGLYCWKQIGMCKIGLSEDGLCMSVKLKFGTQSLI
jgi:hypothetical protein